VGSRRPAHPPALPTLTLSLAESRQRVAAYGVELTARARKQYTALDPVDALRIDVR
jgi:hypothetical protein